MEVHVRQKDRDIERPPKRDDPPKENERPVKEPPLKEPPPDIHEPPNEDIERER
jgi:hypothetical protein